MEHWIILIGPYVAAVTALLALWQSVINARLARDARTKAAAAVAEAEAVAERAAEKATHANELAAEVQKQLREYALQVDGRLNSLVELAKKLAETPAIPMTQADIASQIHAEAKSLLIGGEEPKV